MYLQFFFTFVLSFIGYTFLEIIEIGQPNTVSVLCQLEIEVFGNTEKYSIFASFSSPYFFQLNVEKVVGIKILSQMHSSCSPFKTFRLCEEGSPLCDSGYFPFKPRSSTFNTHTTNNLFYWNWLEFETNHIGPLTNVMVSVLEPIG